MLALLAALAMVPIVICDAGDDVHREVPSGPTMQVNLPARIANRLAAYWLSSGNAYLAPRGLECEGGVGTGDGTESLKVGHRRNGQLVPAFTVATEFGCEGCKLYQSACFFRHAWQTEFREYDDPVPCPRAPREHRVALGRHLMLFEYPTDVRGNGDGSGSRLRAHGVAYLDHVSGTATCVLPGRDKPLCTAMLNYFIRVERQNDVSYLQ